ncbi:MAG TPA: HD domain-containing protein [Kofleriaceae bacterium]|nr:HD domain-containing protein [Kofleriaceae bacterium]
MLEAGLLLRAVEFAAVKHRDQRRKDVERSPYINHPIRVASTLWTHGVHEPHVIVAAILHDTIEDTETTREEIAAQFGEPVAAIVDEVTDDKTQPKHHRKQRQIDHAPELSNAAKLVKLADKICNLRDLNDSPPPDWSLERKREYFDWAAAVVAGVRGVHGELERAFDAQYARKP